MPEKLDHHNGVLRLCIDQATGGHISGRIYSRRLSAPLSFSDMGSLLLQLEQLMDSQNFPQAFQRIRSFAKEGPQYPPSLLPEDAMSPETVAEAQGALATCTLRIITRKNATWQGDLVWSGQEDPVSFSSDLEFLTLVEDYVSAL